MATYVACVILIAYVSLLLELTAIRVPSVASSANLYASRDVLVGGYSLHYQRLFRLHKALKIAFFFAPLSIVYAVYAYPLLVIWLGPDLLGDYLFLPTIALDIAATLLIVAGRALAIATALTLRRDNAQAGESFHLHTTGLLRWSRNPGLVGMYVFCLGVWLAVPSISLLAGMAFYFLYMDFKVRMEEDFLSNKFGAGYVDYCAVTRRYLP
jgi:protein-S-isoprenylcysteine O-methyltransferase Ste14